MTGNPGGEKQGVVPRHVPPPASLKKKRSYLRNLWRSLRVPIRLMIFVVFPLLAAALVFGALATRSIGDAQVAFDLFIGAESTSNYPEARPWSIALAATGFLVIPALASTVLGAVLEQLAGKPS